MDAVLHVLRRIGEILLLLYELAGGLLNLAGVVIVVGIIIFAPGLWLAKRRRDREEREELKRHFAEID